MQQSSGQCALPDVLSAQEHQEAELDHVPRRAVVVAHQVEGHRHVGVAVVTTQVVLNKKQKTNKHCASFGGPSPFFIVTL